MNTIQRHLELDLERLDAVEQGGAANFRIWRCEQTTVVVGRSVNIADEVNLDFCRSEKIPILRRPSGGRSVVVGPGTIQYSFTLPYRLAEELASISGSKRFCNRALIAGLVLPCKIDEDDSGDLTTGGRKFAGLALRRRKSAMLLHGTLLESADLETIAAALQHPSCEPAYRGGRKHLEFLANIGAIDAAALESTVRDLLLDLGQF
jgi:lipoate-protein ligase A